MRFRYAAASVLAALLGFPCLLAGTAQADTVTPLPQLSSVHQVLVDDSAGYVFISEGSGGGIVVTDLAGGYVTTLDAGDGVEGLALQGGTLYAALGADAAVGAIDVATITQTTPTQTLYSLGDDIPYDVVFQSGKLWVSYDDGPGGLGGIGDIDLTAAQPAFAPAVLTGSTWSQAPDLAADPENDGYLVTTDPTVAPANAATYDVADGSTAPLAQTGALTPSICPEGELGISVAPGGATFMVVCDGDPWVSAISTATLAPEGRYGSFPDAQLASAVAIAPNGTVAVAASDGAASTSYISSLAPSGSALNTYEYRSAASVATNGLAWSSDDTKLYAVLVSYANGLPSSATYSLQVIDNAVAPTLTLTGTSSATYGTGVVLSGTVQAGSAAPPAGAKVTITRTASGSSSAATFTASTTASGAFSFTDNSKPVPGHYTYTASFNGESVAHTVTVSAVRSTVTLALHGYYGSATHDSLPFLLYHQSAEVSNAVTVTPSRPGECVRIEVQEYYQSAWVGRLNTPCAALSSVSKVTVNFAASTLARGYPYRVRASFIPSTDPTIVGTNSSWQYIMGEK